MFKETYKEALDAYETFWERTNKKRPIVNLCYGTPDYQMYRQPESLEEKYLDMKYRHEAFKRRRDGLGYMAEGVPTCPSNFGPGCVAACIGSDFKLMPDTIWFGSEKVIEDPENIPSLEFNEQSEMWQLVKKSHEEFSSDEETHFTIADLGGILDIVAALRGTEELLYDLYDYPDEVKEISAKVKKAWFKAFDLSVDAMMKYNQPFDSWMNIPSEKPWYPIQCDFCYMISPDQFEEFVLPDVTDQVNHMPRSIYHLDGAGEIPHLDMLLDIENLTGIQWTPGAGKEPLYDEKWFPLYKKIQDKKKNLVLIGGVEERHMEEAERLVKSLDPTGLYFNVYASSKEKAEEMLEKITRWSE